MSVSRGSYINGEWKLGSRIDDWSKGQTYTATDKNNRRPFLVKFERKSSRNITLSREHESYKQLGAVGNKVIGFPTVYFYGEHGDYNALVLDYITISLSSIMDVYPYISHEMTMSIGIRALERLEHLHSKGLVHGNLNPKSLRFLGNDLYLVNLDHSTRFREGINSEHICFRTGNHKHGDIRFASRNNHAGFNLSRRDDLESLGYVMVYMYTGSLPWTQFGASEKNVIHELKHCVRIRKLCHEMTEEMKKYFRVVRSLEYAETPDYSMLRELFREALRRRDEQEINQFNTGEIPLRDQPPNPCENQPEDAGNSQNVQTDQANDEIHGYTHPADDEPALAAATEGRKNLFARWTTFSSSSSSSDDEEGRPVVQAGNSGHNDHLQARPGTGCPPPSEACPSATTANAAVDLACVTQGPHGGIPGHLATGFQQPNATPMFVGGQPVYNYAAQGATYPGPWNTIPQTLTQVNPPRIGEAPWECLTDHQRAFLASRQAGGMGISEPLASQSRKNAVGTQGATPFNEASVRWAESAYDQLAAPYVCHYQQNNVNIK